MTDRDRKKYRRRRRLCETGAVIVLLAVCFLIGRVVFGDEQTEETPAAMQPAETAQTDQAAETAAAAEKTAAGVRPTAVSAVRGSVRLTAEHISQSAAGFPSGCESAVAVMLMRFWGVDIDMDTFVDAYLDCGEITWTAAGMTAPHPGDRFVGNPRSTAAYGCFAPVIYRAVQDALADTALRVVDETGSSLPELCARYLDEGSPVAVWATIGMLEPYDSDTWTVTGSSDTFTWIAQEHCLLLTGYDDEYYYFNDPWRGSGDNAYSRSLVEKRYEQLGRQALALAPCG